MRGSTPILLLGCANVVLVLLLFRATSLRGGLDGCAPDELRVAVVGERLCPKDAVQNQLVPLLEATWNHKQAEGLLFVTLEGMRERIMSVGDSGHQFVVSVNPGRAGKKVNVPEDLQDVTAELDPEAFNFRKANPAETLFGFRVLANEQTCRLTMACGTVESPPQHHVMLNPYPLSQYSGLLVPFLRQMRNQVLREDALLVAMAFANQMDNPFWRVGYNSLNAGASVNHNHFQYWYLPHVLPCEVANTRLVVSAGRDEDDDGPQAHMRLDREAVLELHESVDFPMAFFAFREVVSAPRRTARMVMQCVQHMLRRNIPHNLVITQNAVYLFPRRAVVPLDDIRPGFPEMAGHIITLRQESYEGLSAEMIINHWQEHLVLPHRTMVDIKRACLLPLK